MVSPVKWGKPERSIQISWRVHSPSSAVWTWAYFKSLASRSREDSYVCAVHQEWVCGDHLEAFGGLMTFIHVERKVSHTASVRYASGLFTFTFTFTQFMFTFTRHLHVRAATRNMFYSYTEERWITTALHVSDGFEAATRYTSESEAHSARATQERGGQIRCESSCRIRFVYVSIRSALVLQSFCCRFGSL
jgi:hypothetical protein